MGVGLCVFGSWGLIWNDVIIKSKTAIQIMMKPTMIIHRSAPMSKSIPAILNKVIFDFSRSIFKDWRMERDAPIRITSD
jgi:hypothetical protein